MSTRTSAVLIVDDNAVLRKALVRVLSDTVDRLLEAATGHEALALAQAHHPDVILLDVILPDLDGLEVCRRIKADPETAGAFVLMISGLRIESEAQAEALEAGADGYVTRPISNRELLVRVETALRLQQTLEELHALTAALQRERDLISRIMEVSPAGVTVVDAAGQVTFANAAAERVLKLSRAEITTRSYDDPTWHITAYDGTPFPNEALPFNRVMTTQQPVHDVRHAIEWPDGTRALLSVSGAPLSDADDQIDRVVFSVTDVTEQVRQNEHIHQLNDVLRAIRDVNQLLTQEKNPDTLIAQACRILVASEVYDNAWITVVGPDGTPQHTAHAGKGFRAEVLADPPNVDLLSRCTVKTFATPGVCSQARCSTQAGICPLREPTDDSVPMAVALRHQMARYGVLSVGVNPAFATDPEAAGLLAEVAGDIALALHKIETEAALAEQVEAERQFELRLETLVAVTNELALARSVDDLCQQAVTLASEKLGFERIGIWLVDEQDPTRQRGTFGIDETGQIRDERGRTVPIDTWLKTWIERAQPEVEYARAIDLHNEQHEIVGTGTWARAMLWSGDKFAGTVSIDNLLSGAPITSRDQQLLRLFATTLSNLLVHTQAEVALQEREQFYRTVFETTGTAMMVLQDDMMVLAVNEETEKLLGYTREALEGKQKFDVFVAPEDHELVVARHHQRRREPDQVPNQYEFRIQDRAGTAKDVAVAVEIIPGTTQSVVSIIDITARKAATASLQRHAAVQSAIGKIAMHTVEAPDLHTLTQEVVEQTLTVLNLEMGSCWCGEIYANHNLPADKAMHLIAQCHPLEAGATVTAIEDAEAETDAAAPCASILRAYGDRAAAIVVNQRPDAPEPETGLLVVSRTPRAWSEEELRLLEAVGWQLSGAAARLGLLTQMARQARRLQHVIDTVPAGVVLLAADSTVLLANPIARSELAFLAEVQVGERIDHLGERSVDEILETPTSGNWHEITHGDRTFEAVAEPLSEAHDLDGWVLVVRNVTQERAIARQLGQQERLAAVGHLAAGIAHDFNNILAVIILYAEMASRRLNIAPDVQRHLQVVQEQAHRASDLIQQILDFSRRAALDRQPMDLGPFLKEQIKLLARTLPENIEIKLVQDDHPLKINADPTRIQQVLMNLATNARDAMPQGGTIRIELREVVFEESNATPVTGMAPGTWVQVAFSDTGEGMPPEVLEKAFEPFFTTKETGTGLGLAQIYGIVKQHGGEVKITTRAGAGTTMALYFPTLGGTSIEAAGESSADTLVGGAGQHILVVEDNAQTRAALVAALGSLNYITLEAGNGVEALEILEGQGDRIDLIVSDAIMPVMGIGRLLEAMVERGYPQKVIVVSGYLEPEEKAKLREAGPLFAWLTKPVGLEELGAVTALALNAR